MAKALTTLAALLTKGRLCAALLAALALTAGAQTLRLDGAQARLEAAQTKLTTCAEDLEILRSARRTEEKAHEAYEQNRDLADPDAARGRMRDGSFLLQGGSLAP